MKSLAIAILALGILPVVGCTTKVVNTPPAAQGPTIIEKHDRPIVQERVIERPTASDRDVVAPKVENNIRVDK